MTRRVHAAQPRLVRGQTGAATFEAAFALPVFALFLALAVVGGRIAIAHQSVQAAAADAARAASLARSAGDASAIAHRAGLASLDNQHLDCLSTTIDIDTTGFRIPVGQPASVRATVTCELDLTDLHLPAVPRSRTITATVVSPLDTYRERTGR